MKNQLTLEFTDEQLDLFTDALQTKYGGGNLDKIARLSHLKFYLLGVLANLVGHDKKEVDNV
ncbi:MAG: hypothetical protein V1858_02145 [Candidatus Gottesmanbacteria bacterium]